MRTTYSRLALPLTLIGAVAIAACGSRPGFGGSDASDVERVDAIADADATSPTDAPREAAVDVATDVPLGEAGAPCTTDTDCDDRIFCNGTERCLERFCRLGALPCDDHVACTIEQCVETSHTCRHQPDDTMCVDTHACNGVEHCAPTDPAADPVTGCQPVQPDNTLDCNDHNDCTIDSCDDTTGCVHGSRDLDNDSHIEQACTVNGLPGGAPGDDCDDTDPTVHPGATEICDDGKDNDCDGQVDFQDTNAGCVATNDSCANARVLAGSGTFWTSTNGLTNDVALSCNTGTVVDSIWTFTLTDTRDVRVSLGTTAASAAVAVTSNCAANALAELGCAHTVSAGGTASSPQLLLRAVAPGTYFIVVENSSTAPFRLSLQLSPPTMPPAGDVCPPTAEALDLASGAPQTAMLGTLADDYTLSCNTGLPRNDGVFRLSLAATSDVDLDLSAPVGTIYASLRNGSCAADTQLRCVTGTSIHTSLRNAAAGDYFIVVENSQNQPVTATAMVHDPANRAPGDSCLTVANIDLPATLPGTGTATVPFGPLLTGSDYSTSCGSNGSPDAWRDAIYRYTLPVQADTTITVTPSAGWNPHYAWQLVTSCGGSTPVGSCTTSLSQSVAHFAGQAAGDYFIEIETDTAPIAGAGFRVDVSAIDTASRPAYEACPGSSIALSGTGTTTTGSITIDASNPALDNFAQSGTSCGSAGFSSGWTDVVFYYTLTAASDVSIRFASDPLRAWFYEFQRTCGASNTRIDPTTPTTASDCNSHTTGGIGSGTPATYTIVNQPAGVYYIVAETSSPNPGSVQVDVTATVH